MDKFNEKIRLLKENLLYLKKKEKDLAAQEDEENSGSPVERLRHQIQSLTKHKQDAIEFNDSVNSVNDKILELRRSFEQIEDDFLKLVDKKSSGFSHSSEFESAQKDIESLRRTKQEIYSLGIFKLKNSVIDVDSFNRKIGPLVAKLEKLECEKDKKICELESELSSSKSMSLEKQRELSGLRDELREKIRKSAEQKDYDLSILKEEVRKQLEKMEARIKGDISLVNVRVDEIHKTIEQMAKNKYVNLKIEDVNSEIENLYNMITDLKKELRGSKANKPGFTKMVDFLAGEK